MRIYQKTKNRIDNNKKKRIKNLIFRYIEQSIFYLLNFHLLNSCFEWVYLPGDPTTGHVFSVHLCGWFPEITPVTYWTQAWQVDPLVILQFNPITLKYLSNRTRSRNRKTLSIDFPFLYWFFLYLLNFLFNCISLVLYF